MNKRHFAALVAGVALLAGGMLAGCGPKEETPTDSPATTTAPAPTGGKMAASPMASPGASPMASPAASTVAPPGPK